MNNDLMRWDNHYRAGKYTRGWVHPTVKWSMNCKSCTAAEGDGEAKDEATRREEAALVTGAVRPGEVGGHAGPYLKRHPLLITFYLGCLAAMGPLAIDMYLPAFPTIAGNLGTDIGSIQRTLSAYFIGMALGQLVYGPVADRVGRKWPLYVGLGIFGVASLGCGLAWGVGSLTVMRVTQALGGCASMVVSRAIVRDLFDVKVGAKVFSQLTLVMGVAPIVAPMLGGYLAVTMGWRAIFWVLAGMSVVLLAFTWLAFDESLPHEKRRRESIGGILRTYGQLLREREFMAYTIMVSLASTGVFAYVGGSSYVFQEIYHIPERKFFIYFGPIAAGMIGMSQVNGFLVGRFALEKILRAALLGTAASGLILLALTLTQTGGFWGLYIPLWCFMASMGFVFANATVLGMKSQGHRAGGASALMGSVQFGLSALGGVLVSILENGSALPMTAVIAICGVGALGVKLWVGKTQVGRL